MSIKPQRIPRPSLWYWGATVLIGLASAQGAPALPGIEPPAQDVRAIRSVYRDASGVHLEIAARPLDEVLAEMERHSGIAFSLPPGLKQAVVSAKAVAPDWTAAVESFLKDFNHLDVRGARGKLERVMVAGYTGDGRTPPPAASAPVIAAASGDHLFEYRSDLPARPETFDGLPQNSVTAIRIDRQQLEAMKPGEQMAVVLPTGQYDLVHDNRVVHENGDFTWIGYLRDDGVSYRAAITLGESGSYGQISTPQGLFRIEPADGQDWLVDVGAAGLTHGPALEEDEQIPPMAMARQFRRTGGRTPPKSPAATGVPMAAIGAAGGVAADPNATTIDVLVLYTPKFARNGSPGSRINNLMALSNQAFSDSQIPIRLRIVKTARVSYQENNTNSAALSALTKGAGSLGIAKTLRSQFGADLVTLLRPFNYGGNKNCGSGWVNGADGRTLSPNYGFSVVGDGRSGAYYCPDYSLVHEMSHNMGSAHDREHASSAGKYPYSYGYSVPGTFGTIMSYELMRVGLFSNPRIASCQGYACGIDASSPAAADNALSLNNVRAAVAAFAPTVIP